MGLSAAQLRRLSRMDPSELSQLRAELDRRLPPLRMYVWEGVFRDYSDGMACALATSADEARALVLKEMGAPSGGAHAVELCPEPTVVETPRAFYVLGGQ